MSINTEGMIEVASVFQGAYKHVTENLLENSHKKAIELSGRLVLQEKPYMMITPEGIPRIVQVVFGDPDYRDFVLWLTHVFLARWGGNYEELCRNLADGASSIIPSGIRTGSNVSAAYIAIPTDISERMSSHNDAFEVFKANKWLVTLTLINLFITVTPEKLGIGSGKRGQE